MTAKQTDTDEFKNLLRTNSTGILPSTIKKCRPKSSYVDLPISANVESPKSAPTIVQEVQTCYTTDMESYISQIEEDNNNINEEIVMYSNVEDGKPELYHNEPLSSYIVEEYSKPQDILLRNSYATTVQPKTQQKPRVEEPSNENGYIEVSDEKKKKEGTCYEPPVCLEEMERPDDLVVFYGDQPIHNLYISQSDIPSVASTSVMDKSRPFPTNDEKAKDLTVGHNREEMLYKFDDSVTKSQQMTTSSSTPTTLLKPKISQHPTLEHQVAKNIFESLQQQQQRPFPSSPQQTTIDNTYLPRDWNEEFQQVKSKITATVSEGSVDALYRVDWSSIHRLSQEFADTATLYAKIIISEIYLPDDYKTFKPVDIGGVAGGQKYKVQNILFKFAFDTQLMNNPPMWMYGGTAGPDHRSALKAAKNELKGLEAHYTTYVSGLHYPMMALIDYKGFRVLAMTVLPIDKTTIRYGSNDSGSHVHASNPELNHKMEVAAKQLNLKGHLTGLRKGRKKVIYGPGDIEAHEGLDGRLYVLDFGRVFPPEDPQLRKKAKPRSVFYSLLRPQLVGDNPVPLCSDAFTNWNAEDDLTLKHLHNDEVTEATRRIYSTLIPQAAQELDSVDFDWETLENSPTPALVKEALDLAGPLTIHPIGLNLRHLGFVRKQSKHPSVRKLILSVCIARVAKDELRDMMRIKMKDVQVPADEPFKRLVVQYLNMLRGSSKASKMFWEEDVKRLLTDNFEDCLTEEEQEKEFDLRSGVDLRVLFALLFETTGVELTSKAMRQLMWMNENFKFVESDIKRIEAITKHKSDVYSSAGFALLIKIHKKSDKAKKKHINEVERELEVCEEGFRLAYNCSPNCPFVLYGWASCLYEMAKSVCTDCDKQFKRIYDKLDCLLKHFPVFPLANQLYAETLTFQANQIELRKDTISDSEDLIQSLLNKARDMQHQADLAFADGWKPACGQTE